MIQRLKEHIGFYDLLIFAGIVSISYGIYQIYVPGMFVFAGLSLIMLGKAGE